MICLFDKLTVEAYNIFCCVTYDVNNDIVPKVWLTIRQLLSDWLKPKKLPLWSWHELTLLVQTMFAIVFSAAVIPTVWTPGFNATSTTVVIATVITVAITMCVAAALVCVCIPSYKLTKNAVHFLMLWYLCRSITTVYWHTHNKWCY